MAKGVVLVWIMLVVACCIAEGFEWSRKRRERQRPSRVVRIAERAARRKAEKGGQ